uniref:Uncharacterized protein n=1 Tax=Solanum tuberosum TaxID=4113 RepID=M1DEH2_SOLTU
MSSQETSDSFFDGSIEFGITFVKVLSLKRPPFKGRGCRLSDLRFCDARAFSGVHKAFATSERGFDLPFSESNSHFSFLNLGNPW